MRRLLGMILVGSSLALLPGSAGAQVLVSGSSPYRLNPYLFGVYGMAFGAPSVGYPRTYTGFSSSFGPGYGYGYAPYGLLPGRYGVGLWRPGFVMPGYVYGASYYRSFPTPIVSSGAVPPIGYYAPGFGAPSPLTYGPPSYYGW